MTFEEYRQYDALGLASLVKNKEVQAIELLEIAIQRIEKVNPKINAVIYTMYEEAKKSANNFNLEGIFAGVPYLFKDLDLHVAGHPLRGGARGYANRISKTDSTIVSRLRQAGLIFLGKTNTPEFGFATYTEPELFGATLNPWNLDHSPGGSSGGSAASVSSGIVPMASAGDAGGSIRIPASCCGLFGLKTTRGRSSYGDTWAGSAVENCITRSVRDTAAMMDTLQGIDTSGETFILKKPTRPYLEEITYEPKKLKIAFSAEHPLGLPVDQECIDAVQHTTKLLRDLGHEVVETKLPYTREALTPVFVMMIMGEAAANVEEMRKYLGRKVKVGDVELSTWMIAALGQTFTAQEYVTFRRSWTHIAREIAIFHQEYDLLLTPTLAKKPVKTGELKPSQKEINQLNLIKNFGLFKLAKKRGIVDKLGAKPLAYIPYTPISNLTGQPSMSVPLHWTKEGLPIGVHFTGRICEEDIMLQLAAQLEKTQPWFDKVPVI